MSTTFNGSNPSSNGINPSEQTNNNQDHSPGITFFDATLARKERMKQMAAGDATNNKQQPAAPNQAVPPAVAPAIPTPVVPTAPVASAPVAPAMSNGNATQPVVPQVPQPVVAPAAPAAPVQSTAPVTATPTTAPSTGVQTGSGEELSRPELEKFMINFVVEQTGYPEEMVELDADLEADLGIDSIKKAQMFGELAEHLKVEIEITEDMSLDDYPTLNHIIDFLLAGSAPTNQAAAPVAATPVAPAMSNGHATQPVVPQVPQPVTTPAAPAAPVQAAAPVTATPTAPSTGVQTGSGEELSRPELEKFMINFVVEQTGYPEEMVELDADLEADLGIDSIKKAQMFGELAEHLKVEIEITEDMSLDDYPTLNHIIDFLLA